MVGISGIISKTERGHSGTGSLGRRSASSLEGLAALALLSAALGSGFQVSALLPACRALCRGCRQWGGHEHRSPCTSQPSVPPPPRGFSFLKCPRGALADIFLL